MARPVRRSRAFSTAKTITGEQVVERGSTVPPPVIFSSALNLHLMMCAGVSGDGISKASTE